MIPTEQIVTNATIDILIILLLLLSIQLGILLFNLRTFKRLHSSDVQAAGPEPFISILIPARNEQQNIAACVRSLIAQDYRSFEIIVLDDQSSDNTAIIVQEIIQELSARQSTRLQLLKGTQLPAGWIGKSHACQQLANSAHGDYLLFTDADTLHDARMLQTVIQQMQLLNVKLLTAQPEEITHSLGERLILPVLNFTVFTLLPLALIYRRPEPSLSMGNGQLLCFERTLYDDLGGHASVKDHILEDVLLARKVKEAGQKMIYVDAFEMIQCRMYHSWQEVWRGFSKNFFAFCHYSLFFALSVVILNLLFFVAPPLLLIGAIVWTLPTTVFLLALSCYLLAVGMRILLAYRFIHTQRLLMILLSLLHPISIALECLILANSIRWRYRKAGTEWKGRYYR
jgi:chlorobactene glucosyltransferase